MNMYKWVDQLYSVHLYSYLFGPDSDVLPAEFPSTREINIQIVKWERLLEERRSALLVAIPRRKAKQMGLVGRGMTKKQLLEDGRLTSRTMQQGRKVHDLALELFKDFFVEQLAKDGRKYSKQNFAKFRLAWDTALLDYRRNFFRRACDKFMFEEMEKKALQEAILPLKRLGSI